MRGPPGRSQHRVWQALDAVTGPAGGRGKRGSRPWRGFSTRRPEQGLLGRQAPGTGPALAPYSKRVPAGQSGSSRSTFEDFQGGAGRSRAHRTCDADVEAIAVLDFTPWQAQARSSDLRHDSSVDGGGQPAPLSCRDLLDVSGAAPRGGFGLLPQSHRSRRRGRPRRRSGLFRD